jgi:hypothetical protein
VVGREALAGTACHFCPRDVDAFGHHELFRVIYYADNDFLY